MVKKKMIGFLKIIALIYIVVCVLFYFFQEKVIFFPQKLKSDHNFQFEHPFKEVMLLSENGYQLNGLHFKADSSKGLIFYLHGNAGSLDSWGRVAGVYLDNNYDVFILDYPGYGKSGGKINSKSQLYGDVQTAYDLIKKQYDQNEIIILGYSIGTGMAAHLASMNQPKQLILQAPYYNLKDLMKHTYPFLPTFLLRYNFETNKYIQNCKMPITVFHGDRDQVIYTGSSNRLKKYFKSKDSLIILPNQTHNGMTDNPDYKNEIKRLLK